MTMTYTVDKAGLQRGAGKSCHVPGGRNDTHDMIEGVGDENRARGIHHNSLGLVKRHQGSTPIGITRLTRAPGNRSHQPRRRNFSQAVVLGVGQQYVQACGSDL